MPTIDFKLDATIKIGSVAFPRQVDLLIGYDDSNRWTVEEATLNGVNVDELGLWDAVVLIAEGMYGERIGHAVAEYEADRLDWGRECAADRASRADDMRRAL